MARPEALPGGSFYGAVEKKHEQCGAIFTDLCHRSARKLPEHSHQLPFFGMLLDGSYREKLPARSAILDRSRSCFVRPTGLIRTRSGREE